MTKEIQQFLIDTKSMSDDKWLQKVRELGYYDEDLTPLKCIHCGSNELEIDNEEFAPASYEICFCLACKQMCARCMEGMWLPYYPESIVARHLSN